MATTEKSVSPPHSEHEHEHEKDVGEKVGTPHHAEEFPVKTDPEAAVNETDDKMTFKKIMALVAMAFLWTGSQIPVYLYGGIPPYIYGDIGGTDRWTWFILGNLFALGAVCPFVGSLSDLFGRRWVAIGGGILLIIGNIVTSTAHSMNTFIAGMAIAGAGAGINELTALAVTSELAPRRKRGIYVSALIFTIIPYCPSVLWAQLVAFYGSWRYIGLWCGVWAFIGVVLTFVFYHPPPVANPQGLTRREILSRVDYIGAALSIPGLLLFLAAIQWGGYQYSWGSAHVIAPLVLGIILIIAFVVYEAKFARYPMFPGSILQEPRIMTLTLIITFISGSNFFSVLLFWPTQSYNVYGHDPWQVGIRNLALGFPIMAGACIVLALISITRGHIRSLMVVSCCFMTAGCGAFAALNRDNVWLAYILLIISGLGIGGIVVPASIISTIVCPDELIATVAALTLAIRVLGGAIGYSIYYNVFSEHFKTEATKKIGRAAVEMGIKDKKVIAGIIGLTAEGLIDHIHKLVPNEKAYEHVILAGQVAYAASYKYVYFVSIAFGAVSIICALFLGNIRKYMTHKVPVTL
ncbi:MFS general substrate transporter [Trichodelitschia bisporula]|uniref:MFS general substrate transporter n=1 Tax=Trichodelitschia bisporula TaxID=703511 RepID=A0A6G1I758_9PEZI|nr:MFS general substrate transporter [Trichodelitschia bisporula]